MRASRGLIQTLRAAPSGIDVERERSLSLLVRAGFIHQLTAGVHTYGPLMVRCLRKIETIIREEHEKVGGQEILMPALQPKTLWEESGRWARYCEEGILYRLQDGRGRWLCLGPTHEEVVTDLARSMVRSHKQLPQLVFQIQTKFRDELRPRAGLLRAREFVMKDAYSFDLDRAGMERSYAMMRRVYLDVFARCGLDVMPVDADAGAIGGAVSEEFMVLSDLGEDTIIVSAAGGAVNVEKAEREGTRKRAIEVGHIFQLGRRYSEPMQATYADASQQQQCLWMGCYGIGVTRMIQALIDQHADAAGMIWPHSVAPLHVHLIQTRRSDEVQTSLSERIYSALWARGVEVLWDERDMGTGAQLFDADLIGLPFRIIVGRDARAGVVEIGERARPGDLRRVCEEDAIAELAVAHT